MKKSIGNLTADEIVMVMIAITLTLVAMGGVLVWWLT